MKQLCLICLAFICLFFLDSCGNKNTFRVEGSIAGYEDTVQVYLTKIIGCDLSVLDSVNPDRKGRFSFVAQADSTPSFYQIKLRKQHINFAAKIGSEINIQVGRNSFSDYVIEDNQGPDNNNIRKIALLKEQTDNRLDHLYRSYQENKLDASQYQDTIAKVIDEFKTTLRNDFIFQDPKSPASYFALFQQKDGLLYFNVYDPMDAKAFAAVATAYDTYYPTSSYTKSVRDLSLLGIAAMRRDRVAKDITTRKIEVKDIPETILIDHKGNEQPLSKVVETNDRVLIVFTSYQAEWSPSLVKEQRALYQRHCNNGFQIYEISVDKDLYFWQNATRTLPWITVNDSEGKAALSFNVRSLPTFFLIQDGEFKRLQRLESL